MVRWRRNGNREPSKVRERQVLARETEHEEEREFGEGGTRRNDGKERTCRAEGTEGN